MGDTDVSSGQPLTWQSTSMGTERTAKDGWTMKKQIFTTAVVMAALSLPMYAAQTSTPSTAATLGGGVSGDAHTWTQDQLLTSTVHEAWLMSGRNEDQFFEMVKELAALSAQKRGVTLPETQEAGARAGAWIKREAKRDPDQLLYAVVDKAVVHVGVKSGGSPK